MVMQGLGECLCMKPFSFLCLESAQSLILGASLASTEIPMETRRQAALGGREGFPREAGEAEPGDILLALGAEVRGCWGGRGRGACGHPAPCFTGNPRRSRVWNVRFEGFWGSLGTLMTSLQILLPPTGPGAT